MLKRVFLRHEKQDIFAVIAADRSEGDNTVKKQESWVSSECFCVWF